jgi:hypothetical protein
MGLRTSQVTWVAPVVRQEVDRGDPAAAPEQPGHQVAADEPAAAEDDGAHGPVRTVGPESPGRRIRSGSHDRMAR